MDKQIAMDLEELLAAFYRAVGVKEKQVILGQIISDPGWYEHYRDRTTGRRVLAESNTLSHDHEKRTAMSLCKWDFDVLFAPKGIFKRDEKRFDALLLRDHIVLKVDL